MSTISFTDIYYPIITDPRYAMLWAIREPLKRMLHYAKQYRNRERKYAWENMQGAYNQLIGTVNAFIAIGMLENSDDVFRIPSIAYKTALKIACGL